MNKEFIYKFITQLSDAELLKLYSILCTDKSLILPKDINDRLRNELKENAELNNKVSILVKNWITNLTK